MSVSTNPGSLPFPALHVTQAVIQDGSKKTTALDLGQQASTFLDQVHRQRLSTLRALSTLTTDPEVKAKAVGLYVASASQLVPGLTDKLAVLEAGAVTSGDDTDANGAADADADSGASDQATGEPPLQGLLTFSWPVSLTAGKNGAQASIQGDISYDITQVLLSSALWDVSKAADAVGGAQSRGPVPQDTVLQAYKLLRCAAATLAGLRRVVLPALPPGPGSRGAVGQCADLHTELLLGLELTCMAEAQALSLLRAIAKQHAPALISGIARDTAALYASALSHLRCFADGGVKSSLLSGGDDVARVDVTSWRGFLRKIGALAKYKHTCCYAYHLAFAGMDQLRQDQSGKAVRLAQEASKFKDLATGKLASDYDAAAPKTSGREHRQFDADLQSEVGKIHARADKDNSNVYLQPVPKEMPPAEAMPPKKRVVEPASPLELAQVPILMAARKAAAAGDTRAPASSSDAPLILAAAAAAELAAALGAGGAAASVAGTAASSAAAGAAGSGAMTAPEHITIHMGAEGPPASAATKAAGTSPAAAAPAPGARAGAAAAPSAAAPAAPAAGSNPEGHERPQNEHTSGCSCGRCLVVAICMPLLLMVSALGILVWLLLLPMKCCICCCPLAMLLQCAWDVLEWMVKAPLRAALWASGDSHWHPGANPHSGGGGGGHGAAGAGHK